MPIKYKATNGITGNTTVYLDSATNLEEAKRDVALLEPTEPWSIQIYNPEKEKRNDVNS